MTAGLARSLGDRPGWREDALCSEIGADLWFPEVGESVRDAKEVCRRCPVRSECLAYAVHRRERFGIWGGLTDRERRELGGSA